MGKPIDLIGQRFGLLTVIALTRQSHRNLRAWVCKCDCGSEAVITTGSLTSGNSKSCGCRKRAVLGESTTRHGQAGTRTYRIWKGMRSRCSNERSSAYDRYGGRGITIDDSWEDFANFLADMGEAPEGLTLDRKDNSRSYSKDNCRWVTYKEQSRNMRSNRLITVLGETHCLSEWAEIVGVDSSTLWKRLKRKPVEDVLGKFVR